MSKWPYLESHRMSRFRDKSALFGKELGPNDPPSWGPPGPYKNRNNENTPSNYNWNRREQYDVKAVTF